MQALLAIDVAGEYVYDPVRLLQRYPLGSFKQGVARPKSMAAIRSLAILRSITSSIP